MRLRIKKEANKNSAGSENGHATRESEDRKKILVIGHDLCLRRITSFSWDSLPKNLNIADFNAVIIDFSPLQRDKVGHPELNKVFTKNRWNLMFNTRAEVVLVGVAANMRMSKGEGIYGQYKELTSWLPASLKYTSASGDTIRNVREGYSFYFKLVTCWQFYFDKAFYKSESLEEISKALSILVDDISMIEEPLARNVYGKSLGCKFNFEVKSSRCRSTRKTCDIIWLPPATSVDSIDAIRLLLKEKYDLFSESHRPIWLSGSSMPSIDKLKKKIEDIEQKAISLSQEKTKFMSTLRDREYLFDLLFEQGDVLENAVRKVLAELGCQIIPVSNKSQEDARFIDPNGMNWICEIKGRKTQLKRVDIRQLDDWLKQAMLNENWKGCACIIGNYLCEIQPSNRQEIVSDNERTALERFGFTLIETTALFECVKNMESSTYDAKNYWAKAAQKTKPS